MNKLSAIAKNRKVLIFLMMLGVLIFVFAISKINDKTAEPIQPPISKEEEMEKIIRSLTAPASSVDETSKELIESATAPEAEDFNSESNKPPSEEIIRSLTAPGE